MNQMQTLLLQFTFFIFFFLLSVILAASPPPSLKALVAPINKESHTSLYTLTLNRNKEFVLDITGTLLWSRCPKTHPLVSCHSHHCNSANTFRSPLCPAPAMAPRCFGTCVVAPVNSITQSCAVADLTYVDLTLSSTDGESPIAPVTVPRFVASCTPKSLFKSLPAGSSGMAGLARSRAALPTQLTAAFSLARQFAVCLPSTSTSPGVAFFGEGPFLLHSRGDLAAALSYTPLLKNPTNPDYYIDVKAVAVGGATVRFLARMLDFDAAGNGGVKLSTVAPYTLLKSHIYRAFLKKFSLATKEIPRAKKVKPFDLCLNTTKLGSTLLGLPVPQVDLVLANGRNWTIFGANSMKQVADDVACLAVVDGGEWAEQAAVIGSHQLENNFLLFDLARSRIGFSSSLFGMRTTCANFNF